jgi:hypothetical protein
MMESRDSRMNSPKKSKMADEIRPDSVSEPIDEVANFVGSNRETKAMITQLENLKALVITTDARL